MLYLGNGEQRRASTIGRVVTSLVDQSEPSPAPASHLLSILQVATAPDGSLWTWGPADAADRITGPALHFALLVTRRRHRDDLALEVVGPHAQEWVGIAQAFAGPPGSGRAPGSAP